mgnify:CR=1 FL=1
MISNFEIRRGDVFYADLSPVVGSEQGGVRPVLIIQNNVGNHYSPTVIIAAITARETKPKMPTHVRLSSEKSRISRNSVILLEQIRTIDKQRLSDRVDHLSGPIMKEVDQALERSVGLSPRYANYHPRTV